MIVIITDGDPEEERLLAGNIHPLYSATLYLVGDGVPRTISAHIRDLNSLLLLLLLLLLDYPIASPLPLLRDKWDGIVMGVRGGAMG